MTQLSPSSPQTLFALAGRQPVVLPMESMVLVLVDCQNEYAGGVLALPDIAQATARARDLLSAARRRGLRIIHIAHKGTAGGMFDRDDWRGAIMPGLAPVDGEIVIEKPRPNSFSGTGLAEAVGGSGQPVLVAGFMTHMCVSSTARAALDLGYPVTIAADACATRDLPLPQGGVIDARNLHAAELAALADRFATIADVEAILAA
jgi:nicotinamidase-related amidase